MIIDEKIEIAISNRVKNYYINLGYDVPNVKNAKIEIYTKDLYNESCINVKCKCDVCGKIKNVIYRKYKKSIDKYGYYTCKGICSQEKRKQTCLNNFGVEYPFQSNDIKEKRKQTYFEKYGVENPQQNIKIKEKTKQTCLEKYYVDNPSKFKEFKDRRTQTILNKYGVENAFYLDIFKDKAKQTCLQKYGFEHPLQNEIVKEKRKQTCLIKYGVCQPLQFYGFYLKQQNSSLLRKKYKDTHLYYQGTFEKDFLDKYYNNLNIDIKNGITIKYKFENKDCVYFSDFYITSKNLIVEIKSEYYYNLHLERNLSKQNYCIEQGYNFIFIINKDYDEFNKKIKEA